MTGSTVLMTGSTVLMAGGTVLMTGGTVLMTGGTGLMTLGFYWGLTPQQQPGSYQGSEMMMMKSVFWWRKPEYPEETTDLRQVTGTSRWHYRKTSL